MIKILFLGEIIGIPTVKEIRKKLKDIKRENNIDFVIANADGASDGYGLLSDTVFQLHNAGIDVLTSGDMIFNKKDIKETLSKVGFLLRPYNLPSSLPGRGYSIYKIKEDIHIAVLNLLGRINFNKIFANDPFFSVDRALEKIKETTNIIIVDFHGGTTSEIQCMHWHLENKASLVIGTNLRVLTSDNRILNQYTGVITGAGFCGGKISIFGLSPETEIKKIKTGQFLYSKIVSENIQLQGVIAEIEEDTGKAVSIELFKKDLV
ncbi:MAG TPA: TIGR00282 family metallophosphoesterase [Spirochaetota bacterium]|nr:TIGR00282 family metallophosphoesterase [Spirochaetota bacterium]HOL56700.1 TIGR00282 family metallophosphoesterase [Spirochaetota bacterium]HPP04113.1 TIGR00282 family metallophosphoesterase [Spirochaetota bacterium]